MMFGFIFAFLLSLLSCATAKKLTYTLSPCTLTTEQVQNLTVASSAMLPMTPCARLCSRTNGCGAFVTSPSCVLLQYPHHEPSCAPIAGDTAFYQLHSEDPPCEIEIGVYGGRGFDFMPTYLASDESPLSRIRVFYSSPIEKALYLMGIEVRYGNSHVESHGSITHTGVGECVLAEGEYIYRVEIGRNDWKTNIVIGSIAFITTRQTCGPYGKAPITDSAEGTRLLYFKGRRGSRFDRFTFTFDACIP